MPDIRVTWADGRTEVHRIAVPCQTIRVGKMDHPITCTVPLGKDVYQFGRIIPWCRVQVRSHGESPSIVSLPLRSQPDATPARIVPKEERA